MRIRRLELVVIGLTIAFICFLSGYFTGVKTAVNVVSVAPQDGQTQSISSGAAGNPAEAQPAREQNAQESGETADANAQPDASPGQATEQPGAPRNNDGRININSASHAELMDLPGIGTVIAGRIIEYRSLNGPFANIEEIRNVSGIGEKRYETIREKITV